MWRKCQFQDLFYRKAKEQGFRSRSAYKLLEIQKKFKIIGTNSSVLDLGCAPGGWLQVASEITKNFVCGIDLNCIVPIPNVRFGQLDCYDTLAMENFLSSINAPGKFDVILSDMSPKLSGDKLVDHINSVNLLLLFWNLCNFRLNFNGCGAAKVFEGNKLSCVLKVLSKSAKVSRFKPFSSRPESKEFYIIINKFRALDIK